MRTSKLWSALLLSCAACGSSFHSNDVASGGDASGGDGTSAGGAVAGGGTSSGGRTGSSGGSNTGGNSGGMTSSGGSVSVGGDLSIGGVVGVAGGNSGGGDVSVSGSTSGGGSSAGSGTTGGSAGSGATAGAGGSTGADCTKLWTVYSDLVTKAQVCDAGVSGECVANSNIINECSCAVPVNQKSSSYADAEKALQAWRNAGCTTKLCPCAVPGTPTCTLDTGGYTCEAGGVATPG